MGILSISGSTRKTADGVVGRSGQATRVYNITWLSGTTAGYVALRNGTGTASDIYFYLDGTASKSKVQNWHNGLLFPSGCYCDIDANVTSAMLEFSNEM